MRMFVIAAAFVAAFVSSASAETPVITLHQIIDAIDSYSDQVCPKQDNPAVCEIDALKAKEDAQRALINLGEIGLAVTVDNSRLEADARRNLVENLALLNQKLADLKAKYGRADKLTLK